MTNEIVKNQKQEIQKTERPLPIYRPSVDIIETNEAYKIYVDLPGVDESKINLEVEKHELRLDAETSIRTTDLGKPIFCEFRPVHYRRIFTLGEEIDKNGIKAQMKQGVLYLELPKIKEVLPRKIEVIAG